MPYQRFVHAQGGPLDGAEIFSDAMFVKITGAVYRWVAGIYRFQGYAAFQCEGCGAWITPAPDRRLAECPFCGHDRGSLNG